MDKKKLRKWNNILHRDIGYFFVVMTIVYALSGIALNHINDWNPNYIINREKISTSVRGTKSDISKESILKSLQEFNLDDEYKSHYFPSDSRLKVFIDDGSIDIDFKTGAAVIETIKRRPIFYEVNYLHYNPGGLWMWFSDIYAVSLILLAVTGLFVLKGKKGIMGRGWKFGLAGLIIPVLFLIFLL